MSITFFHRAGLMKIVVEGPDNSGKSTLIRHLSGSLGIPVVPGEGPGRSSDEINDRVRRYALIDNAIFDRHPCISQPIYNNFRDGPKIDPILIEEFYQHDLLIIYCRGRATLDGTIWRDVDEVTDANGVKHQDTVERNHHHICAIYDDWAAGRAHMIYRIGDGFSRVTAQVAAMSSYRHFDPVADIADFHTKFGLTYDGPPRVLPVAMSDFRKKFMDEELNEYGASEAQASAERFLLSKPDQANYAFHLENMLDALVDEVYVVLGTSYLHGFNFREAWRRVHAANMRKIRATKAGPDAKDSGRAKEFDIVKPRGWEAPSHIDLVEDNDLSLPKKTIVDTSRVDDHISVD